VSDVRAPGGVDSFAGRTAVVVGARVAGLAAARALLAAGAHVTVVDDRDSDVERERCRPLLADGAVIALGAQVPRPAGADLVVVSPGIPPHHRMAAPGPEIIGDAELAWRLRPAGDAPWLAVTGTNGKTTTVRMLEAMCRAAGKEVRAAGNVGDPLITAIGSGLDLLVVELSSFQLHWSSTLNPLAASVLNLAPDHIDWHGSFDAYGAAKARIYGPDTMAVVNRDDPVSAALAPDRPTVGFTTGHPAAGDWGVVDGALVGPEGSAFASVADVRPVGEHNVANALAAAALATLGGATPTSLAAGLRDYRPEPHRNATVAIVDGVRYVDDSKATNPHAAAASLGAYEHVVWIAGGLLKGADVDELVAAHAHRLRAVALIGADRHLIAQALARHAPDVPVLDLAVTDTGAMTEAVTWAAGMARAGDTVLLAPSAASMDMFVNYASRGDAFAAAVAAVESVR
jgi:UDP-N-acetylmuramoylalanine--D-glutamate ligase